MAKLYFKYGPMKCGKTTDIIKTYYNYKEKDNQEMTKKQVVKYKIELEPN